MCICVSLGLGEKYSQKLPKIWIVLLTIKFCFISYTKYRTNQFMCITLIRQSFTDMETVNREWGHRSMDWDQRQ